MMQARCLKTVDRYKRDVEEIFVRAAGRGGQYQEAADDARPPSSKIRDPPRTLASQGTSALPCQHSQRRHQYALRLLLAYQPVAQTLGGPF